MAILDQAVVSDVLNIEDLNIKFDNFTISIDMRDEKLKDIDVKSSSLFYDLSTDIEHAYWETFVHVEK